MSVNLSMNPFNWYQTFSKTGGFLDEDPLMSQNSSFAMHQGTMGGDDKLGSERAYQEKLALINKFATVIETRKQLLKTLKSLRKVPITQTIIDAYINEGFYSNNSFETFDVLYTGEAFNEEINDELKKFNSKFQMQQVIIDMLPNLITLGDFLLTPKVDINQQAGVVDLLDNAIIEDILPIYRGQNRQQFFKLTNNPTKPVQELDPETYIMFSIPNDPIRVKLDFTNNGVLESYNLPEYIKMGRSIFTTAIDMIKRLEMLELANLALALRKILIPLILSMGVPAGTPTKDVISLVKHFENHLEQIFSEMGNTDNLTVTQIMALSSKVRIIPQYSDGKGTTEALNIGSTKEPDTDATNNLKKEIAVSTSTPYYFVATDGTESVNDQQIMQKTYGKFTKKLNELQHAVKTGLANLYVLHFKNFNGGRIVKATDFSINFKQVLNVDALNNMELLVGSAASIEQIYNAVKPITQDPELSIGLDKEVLLRILNGAFDNVPNARGLFIKRKAIQASFDDINGGVIPQGNGQPEDNGDLQMNTGNNSNVQGTEGLAPDEYKDAMNDPENVKFLQQMGK